MLLMWSYGLKKYTQKTTLKSEETENQKAP